MQSRSGRKKSQHQPAWQIIIAPCLFWKLYILDLQMGKTQTRMTFKETTPSKQTFDLIRFFAKQHLWHMAPIKPHIAHGILLSFAATQAAKLRQNNDSSVNSRLQTNDQEIKGMHSVDIAKPYGRMQVSLTCLSMTPINTFRTANAWHPRVNRSLTAELPGWKLKRFWNPILILTLSCHIFTFQSTSPQRRILQKNSNRI